MGAEEIGFDELFDEQSDKADFEQGLHRIEDLLEMLL